MEPFDPQWTFGRLVEELNERHRPGSVTSGKARNVLIQAWALSVGKSRAVEELREVIKRVGSRRRAATELRMSTSTISELESFFSSVPERAVLPEDAAGLRSAFDALLEQGRADFLKVSAELLRDPATLGRLASSPVVRQLASTIGMAVRAFMLRDAVDELRDNLAANVADERTYQDWCERHSWAFGNAYVLRDDVRYLDNENTVDMLLPNLVGYRDIVELKRPDETVLVWDSSHKGYYLSASCSRAIGQVHKYMDRLHDIARQGLRGHPHVVAYHPRSIVVVGRSGDWNERKTRALRGLNERLHGVTIMTYDHLLAQAEQLVATIGA